MDRIASLADYQRVRAEAVWDRRPQFNFARDILDDWAVRQPDQAALMIVSGTEITRSFAEVARASQRVAAALAASGITPGTSVLVLLPRVPEWWEAMSGLLRAGVVAVPGTGLLTPKDIAYRAKAAGAQAVITDRVGAEKIDALGPAAVDLRLRILVDSESRAGWINWNDWLATGFDSYVAPATRSDDPALIYFTSGTTGMPKRVLHTQASYGLGHRATGEYWLDLRPGDLHWNISDTGWAKAAWSSFFGPWLCGATVFAWDQTGKFTAPMLLRLMEQHPITSLCAPPTVYRMLVQADLAGFRPASLRSCVAAGEPLNPEVISTWREATGLTIRDGYGQTETVLLCGNFPGIEVRPGSMGLPTPGFDLAVIDDDGVRLPPGKEGDIALRVEPERPLGLFQEYAGDAAATAFAFRQGWYRTGDRARVDEDGYFWFVGRADDVITSSAYRIGPFEVESALIERPEVAEAAVVGSPDPLRGEIVKAFVVLAAGYEPSETLAIQLQEHVKQSTAPYKYPREIEFVESLPKTTSGKIRRIDLREAERRRKGTAAPGG